MIGSSAGFPTIDFSPYGAHRLGPRSCPGLCWSTLAVNCQLICVSRSVDEDCDLVTADASALLAQLGLLVQISSWNIEGITISSLAADILINLQSIAVLSFERQATLISIRGTFMFCVFSYISQIFIIESARLEVAGTLAFPGATIPLWPGLMLWT